jgi:hypothetical protein
MRTVGVVVGLLMSSAAMAANIPLSGVYASDVRDCGNSGPLYGIVLASDALEQSEMYCPRREWHAVGTSYRSLCAQEGSKPYTLTFSLTPQPNGSLLYAEKGYSVALRRCE